ncbi:hypothetical protein HMPREF9413_4403 [Paenibacillus sp. HGF7]|nr:hypothetical protein HMPREF9413_4403 [Paenibacillus sp. HGF7]
MDLYKLLGAYIHREQAETGSLEEFACEMQKAEQAELTGIPGSMAG